MPLPPIVRFFLKKISHRVVFYTKLFANLSTPLESPNPDIEIVIASEAKPGSPKSQRLFGVKVNLKPLQKDCENPSGSRNDSKDAPGASLNRDLGKVSDVQCLHHSG
ncbi:MAG: hypothetical protein COW90_03180 [Nitrospirae bacterium CG22_combo_CG10-13_8_21_14_all_44_11]|nr:MAG: hypothetical protein AUJ60_00820 [Nitrospirae bacterium CG1_02_44_142]PIP70839.1 MAG: hypothetical protein COW90_03180 [Nitrospirae bacterium CG22_combo_CG10-13_8_21_14_all_44_11]PIV42653.1 MAG: hypothetical protein COS28_03225 [Nitrospirae bacterium CG02_land_8_20_14_3_00_44_33]